jgi:hypothetical protein
MYYQKNLDKTNLTISRKIINDNSSVPHLPPKSGGWLTCFWQQVWHTRVTLISFIEVVRFIFLRFFDSTSDVVIKVVKCL